MPIAYIKTADEAEWIALRDEHFPEGTAQIDEIGVIFHDTGTTQEVDGVTVPVMEAVLGWHVNVIADAVPEAVYPYLVNPIQPKRVFYGAEVLTMPETMPEAGGTVLVERGVGQSVPDDVVARLELAVLRGRLTEEQAEDRMALLQLNLDLVDARMRAGDLRLARDTAVAELQAATLTVQAIDAERDALVAERDAKVAERQAAVDALATLTGAARRPEVERRDAATAEINRLAPLIIEKADEITMARERQTELAAAAQAARDAVSTANNTIITLRTQRNALLAK